MQSDFAQHLSKETWRTLAEEESTQQTGAAQATALQNGAELTHFQSHFVGSMELRSDAQTVTQYLNAHQGWFCRCAHPMTVEPVGEHGYLLTVGRYGSFGFEVEPKIGLHLLPPDEQGVYRIETIPGLVSEDQGYKVDFQASLQLVDCPISNAEASYSKTTPVTHVQWDLDLSVCLLFPKFIRRLPHTLIQVTGDRLLQQIVRQVSRRLTAKVQDDFNKNLAETV
jgi:Protein of unknown function (DUF1997)